MPPAVARRARRSCWHHGAIGGLQKDIYYAGGQGPIVQLSLGAIGQAPANSSITGLSWDGTRAQWSYCLSATKTQCSGGYRAPSDFLPGTYPPFSDGARNILGDATQLYYISNTELIRGVH